jgi:hypothetical protein
MLAMFGPRTGAAVALALSLIALGCTAYAQPPPLKDQFGATGHLHDHLGSTQVVIVVSAKRLRRIKRWERALRRHYPDVPILRVADLPRNTPVDYEVVAAKLRRRLPEEVGVLIDLEGRWSAEYGLDTSVPNVLVFDAAGELAAKRAGKYDRDLFGALRGELDRLAQ